MVFSKAGGIAPKNAAHAAEPESGDVLAQQRAGLGRIVDEQREIRSTRERFQPERTRAGK